MKNILLVSANTEELPTTCYLIEHIISDLRVSFREKSKRITKWSKIKNLTNLRAITDFAKKFSVVATYAG